MPRANRYFLPGHVWHITHRCHGSEFLLRYARDRRRYLYWLFEARKRFGLRVLDYMVTSNHVHLLLQDAGAGEIAASMQLVAGRVGQEFNQRKRRRGAFWEDRYHATAVQCDDHFKRCLAYVDLNMVRAGVVKHPSEWDQSGYREIQDPPQRYAIVDLAALTALCGFSALAQLQKAQRQWVSEALGSTRRDPCWTDAIAVGDRRFVDTVQQDLGLRAVYREVEELDGRHMLRETDSAYNGVSGTKNAGLSPKNTFYWR